MPIPKPRKNEERDEFISRCVSDDTMQREFPDTKQRLAICYSSWREVHSKEKRPEEALMLYGDSKLEEAVRLPGGMYRVHGVAIHPIVTHHPGDWAEKRIYFEDELKKAIPSLIGKPIFVDHRIPLGGCKVVDAKWDERESGVYFEAEITEDVYKKLKNGELTGKVSVSVNPWVRGGGVKFVNGIAPFDFVFDELSFLKSTPPGDANAWVKLIEATRSPEFLIYRVKDVEKISRIRYTWIDIANGIQGIYVSPVEENSYDLCALVFAYDKGWSVEKIMEWLSYHPQYMRPRQFVTLEPPEIVIKEEAEAGSVTESAPKPIKIK